jgi:UDP-N-acetyl-2-amino-2-deoxyglucuronate dehydrogenase
MIVGSPKHRRTFALVGAAGYIAPRHMKAIADTKNELVAAFDPSDSVGVLDSYFPGAEFFTEFERFDRFLDKMRRRNDGNAVDFVTICSPNYLHDAHIRFALRSNADAICEKPLVLNPWNIDALVEIERDTGRQVHTILQLRLHPTIISLRERVAAARPSDVLDVDLAYVTSRGRWYLRSWKGDQAKSGGIATNIGVHFFDMLHWVFGNLRENVVHHLSPTAAGGYLEYDRARVRWFLSVDVEDVPEPLRARGQRTYRAITVDGEEIEFSEGFTDLHTRSYEAILRGEGFGLEENRVAIQTVAAIRQATPVTRGEMHPMTRRIRSMTLVAQP